MATMQTLDLLKQLKGFYSASAKEATVVAVPRLTFFMVDGAGDPNTAQSYREAVEALYAAAYTLKFAIRKGPRAIDYGVMPLEGLWWVDGGGPPDFTRKDAWLWTAMIMQPDFIVTDQALAAVAEVQKKRDLPGLSRIRFDSFQEGQAAQVLHIGPYAAEQPTIARLHAYIEQHGGRLTGKHHEIYLGDPRRTAPERLRTIIRQPFS